MDRRGYLWGAVVALAGCSDLINGGSNANKTSTAAPESIEQITDPSPTPTDALSYTLNAPDSAEFGTVSSFEVVVENNTEAAEVPTPEITVLYEDVDASRVIRPEFPEVPSGDSYSTSVDIVPDFAGDLTASLSSQSASVAVSPASSTGDAVPIGEDGSVAIENVRFEHGLFLESNQSSDLLLPRSDHVFLVMDVVVEEASSTEFPDIPSDRFVGVSHSGILFTDETIPVEYDALQISSTPYRESDSDTGFVIVEAPHASVADGFKLQWHRNGLNGLPEAVWSYIRFANGVLVEPTVPTPSVPARISRNQSYTIEISLENRAEVDLIYRDILEAKPSNEESWSKLAQIEQPVPAGGTEIWSRDLGYTFGDAYDVSFRLQRLDGIIGIADIGPPRIPIGESYMSSQGLEITVIDTGVGDLVEYDDGDHTVTFRNSDGTYGCIKVRVKNTGNAQPLTPTSSFSIIGKRETQDDVPFFMEDADRFYKPVSGPPYYHTSSEQAVSSGATDTGWILFDMDTGFGTRGPVDVRWADPAGDEAVLWHGTFE